MPSSSILSHLRMRWAHLRHLSFIVESLPAFFLVPLEFLKRQPSYRFIGFLSSGFGTNLGPIPNVHLEGFTVSPGHDWLDTFWGIGRLQKACWKLLRCTSILSVSFTLKYWFLTMWTKFNVDNNEPFLMLENITEFGKEACAKWQSQMKLLTLLYFNILHCLISHLINLIVFKILLKLTMHSTKIKRYFFYGKYAFMILDAFYNFFCIMDCTVSVTIFEWWKASSIIFLFFIFSS